MISDHGLMGGAPEGTSKMLTMKHIHLRVEHGAQLNTLKVVSDPLIRGAACRLRTIVTTRPENAARWFPTEIRNPPPYCGNHIDHRPYRPYRRIIDHHRHW